MQEHTRSLIEQLRPAPFSYDHERRLFLSGDKEFTAIELPEWTGYLAADTEEERIPVPDIPFVQTLYKPIMLPRMYHWLADNMTDDLFGETAGVMRDVYVDLVPDSAAVPKRDKGGFMGFDMQRIRAEHPHFTLTTLGNCACLGVEVDGMFGERDWNDKVASFEFHNTDTPAQMKSLLAGIGHIAHRAQ